MTKTGTRKIKSTLAALAMTAFGSVDYADSGEVADGVQVSPDRDMTLLFGADRLKNSVVPLNVNMAADVLSYIRSLKAHGAATETPKIEMLKVSLQRPQNEADVKPEPKKEVIVEKTSAKTVFAGCAGDQTYNQSYKILMGGNDRIATAVTPIIRDAARAFRILDEAFSMQAAKEHPAIPAGWPSVQAAIIHCTAKFQHNQNPCKNAESDI